MLPRRSEGDRRANSRRGTTAGSASHFLSSRQIPDVDFAGKPGREGAVKSFHRFRRIAAAPEAKHNCPLVFGLGSTMAVSSLCRSIHPCDLFFGRAFGFGFLFGFAALDAL